MGHCLKEPIRDHMALWFLANFFAIAKYLQFKGILMRILYMEGESESQSKE